MGAAAWYVSRTDRPAARAVRIVRKRRFDVRKGHVRQKLEALPGVTRTWIEWEAAEHGLAKTLVVEVAFDTDPNSSDCETGTLDDITQTAKDAQTTMIISRLKIVPHDR